MPNWDYRPGFVELKRTTGKLAWVRVDEITALLESEEKRDGKPVETITIQIRNNVSLHVEATIDELKSRIQQASGQNMHIIPWGDDPPKADPVSAEE